MLSITADDSIAQQTHHYRVRVYAWASSKGALRSETRFTRGDFTSWPARTGVVAHRDRQDEEYLAEVIAYGDEQETAPRSLARVISRFVRGRVILVPMHLYPNCHCADEASTCDVSGTCTSARQDPNSLPEVVPNAPRPMDAAIHADADHDDADHDGTIVAPESGADASRLDASMLDGAMSPRESHDAQATSSDAHAIDTFSTDALGPNTPDTDAPRTDSSVSFENPFVTNACSGTRMTTEAALAMLGGAARIPIASATVYERWRTCTTMFNCTAWRGPRPFAANVQTGWTTAGAPEWTPFPVDTQLILYGDTSSSANRTIPTWSIRHATHVRRYPMADHRGITFPMPVVTAFQIPTVWIWNEAPNVEEHERELEAQLGRDAELSVYEHCAYLRFHYVDIVTRQSTGEYAAIYRF